MLNAEQSAEITYPVDGVRIHMNKIAFEQIMVNLIQNALKYNDKENPKVVISFSEDDQYYSFSVTDNGKGIAPAEQERIFELFTTLGIRDRFGTKGTGIGLSTVKRLVEKMGGKVMVKSTPDEGSEFSFNIKKEK
jgi:signal transduction histidine kinase